MNNLLPPLSINPLSKLSPSRYCDLKSCELKGILSENHFPPLIPTSPSAYLGSIIHNLFEFASKGIINDDDELIQTWSRLIKLKEKEMTENTLESHLVPIESNTRHFEVKKMMAFNTIRNIINNRQTNVKTIHFETEKWLETDDGKIVGKIDLIKKKNEDIQIIDLKTGNITDENSNDVIVKKEYQLQLKMYAALYYLSYNVWPSKLILEGTNRQNYEISFNPQECLDILNCAKNELDKINSFIESGRPPEDFATPSINSCKFCVYRPACNKYWNNRKNTDGWPIDVVGNLKDKMRLGNGFYKVVIFDNDKEISIRGLSGRHKFLEFEVNKVLFCNLIKDNTEDNYKETIMTVGYKL